MASKARRSRTPSEIIAGLVQAAMTADGMTAQELAKRAGVHANTVYRDLKDPDRIPQSRLWRYFVTLGVPVQAALDGIADALAESLTRR